MTGVLVAGIVTDFTDWLDDISGEWWFLLVILAVAYFDSVIPIVPSETTVIIGGVAAGLGNQSLLLVIAAGALGAFLGDNTAYLIGRKLSASIERWAARKPKRVARLEWADTQIRLPRRLAAHHRPLHPRRAERAHHLVGHHQSATPVVRRRGSGWPR